MKISLATANNVFYCSYSEKYLVLLASLFTTFEADVFGKSGQIADVFLLGSKLCRPCHRRGPLLEIIEGPG